MLLAVCWLIFKKDMFVLDEEGRRVLPVLRGLLQVNILGWAFTVSCWIMSQNGVDYKILYPVPLRSLGLSSQLAFNLVMSWLILAVGVGWLGDHAQLFVVGISRRMLWWPAWVVVLGVLLCPFKVFCHQFRWALLREGAEFLYSPITGHHSFLSTYVSEHLTSSTTLLKDSIYTACYYYYLPAMTKLRKTPCLHHAKLLGGVYGYLLFYGIKLLLCYHDYRHHCPPRKLLTKLAKIIPTLATCVLAYQASHHSSLQRTWLYSAIFTYAMHLLHDLVINYYQEGVPASQLRQALLAFNILVRAGQVACLFPQASAFLGLSPDWFMLFTAALELVRRNIWNIVVIDNEQHHRQQTYAIQPLLSTGYFKQCKAMSEDKISKVFSKKLTDDFIGLAAEDWAVRARESRLKLLKMSGLQESH
jgi:hypothetical protein